MSAVGLPLPSISIIIATASRPTALEETLRSLSKVHVPHSWNVEVVLVENVAQSGGAELLQKCLGGNFSSQYLFEPQRGKSRALNLALAQSSGEILLFSDDDVRFPADWIERLAEPIVSGRADAVAGGVRLAPHLLRPWMNHTHRAMLASTADYLSANDPSELCGANMAVHRRVFERVGEFEPELGPGVTAGGEESLLSWKLKAAGFRMVGALDIEVEHHPSTDRLCYGNWVKAAQLKGEARAFLAHHWFAREVRFPRIQRLYFIAKLGIRRALTGRPKAGDEGIAPWELSYVESISMLSRTIRERSKPRKHSRDPITRISSGPLASNV